MTANIDNIVTRFAQQAGTEHPRMLHNSRSNVFVGNGDRSLYSFGHHFELARIMPDGDNPRGWWLVNGDNYSNSTARHQSAVRAALAGTELPVLTVPHSALNEASIIHGSIVPVHIRPNRYEIVTHRGDFADMPSYMRPTGQGESETGFWYYRDTEKIVRKIDGGPYEWDIRVHHLGDALFRADYYDDEYAKKNAYFLSSFDENEGFGLYFLAQLPDGVSPRTVEEAFETLKPQQVKDAEAKNVKVKRQGEVFAIPLTVDTRNLPRPSEHSALVVETDHVATEVRHALDNTYARGTLRHRPGFGRRPEHRMLVLGRQWHLLVRNTVPQGRSWSLGGNVD